LGGGDSRELGVAVRALRLLGTAQAPDLPLSAVCDPDHWSHPFWRRFVDSWSCATPYVVISQENRSRKTWEWIHGMAGLARLGCLAPDARALGIAVGHEPPAYWLASRVASVYATDLYRGWFVGHEANPDVLDDPAKYAPYPYPRERVAFFPMSGTAIAFGDATIDFIFSFCSIEHFGGLAQSRRSLREMARVLRPGGIAVVSTELLLNDVALQDALPEIYMFTPWELYEELIAPSGLLMIGDIAPANLIRYCADPVDIADRAMMAAPPQWFVLRYGEALFTSVMFFLQKV
jgi:SAM-dependent methyltransferase